MLPLPIEYVSSICEIKTMENELVATGTIQKITEEYIEVSDKTGAMPLAEFGKVVKINVFNSRQGFRVLAGKVFTSSLKFLHLVDITSLLDYERRHFFRVDTEMQAAILRVSVRNRGAGNEIPVIIRNLSLGGALLLCHEELERNEDVYLKIKLQRCAYSFKAKVCRQDEYLSNANGTYYGCTFSDMTDRESNALCAFIFQRQREQISQRKSQQ